MNKKIIIAAALIALSPGLAMAKPGYFKKFKAAYPNATKLAEVGCALCHNQENETMTAYGLDLEREGINFQAIEALDSDGDGFTNIQEINADTNPAERDSHP